MDNDFPDIQKPIEPILEAEKNNKGKHEENFDDDNLLLYIEGLDKIIDYLKKKYKNKNIYSSIGQNLLISINPYENINNYKLLNDMIISSKRNMLKTKESQNFIINGESGSGKTETAKQILKILTNSNNDEISKNIMDSIPILEAFGNAKTILNDNSSRFGNFIEINFSKEGKILNAHIECYLFEKSRVVHIQENEENYKIFYQILLGKNEEEEKKYKIKSVDYYKYLNNKLIKEKEGHRKDFQQTKKCLDDFDFSEEDKDNIFKILIGILYLGNIEFIKNENKQGVDIVDNKKEDLEIASELLGLTKDNLIKVLTTKYRPKTQVVVYYDEEKAENIRDSIAKELYSKLFEYIINKINNKINKNNDNNNEYTLSILDIFGFENFKINSFEQLNINYSNERLQQYFYKEIFKSEMEIYDKEGINYDKNKIKYTDNQNIIDLIDKPKESIFAFLKNSLLESTENNRDQWFRRSVYCKLSKKMDITKLYKPMETETLMYVPAERNSLYIKHYADKVKYNVTGMWKKNILNSNNDITLTFKNTNNALIKNLYKNDKIVEIDVLITKQKTLVEEFRDQITKLFKNKFDGHDNKFIKCIKPNMEKKDNFFDEKIISKQIKYLGIEAAFHIIKNGYPIKKKKIDFIKEYKLLFPEINIESFDEKIENEMKKIGNNEFNDLYKNGKNIYFFMKDDLNRILNEKLMEIKGKI